MSLTFSPENERDVIVRLADTVETLLREYRQASPGTSDCRALLLADYETAGLSRNTLCARLGVDDNTIGADVLKKTIDLAHQRL